MTLLSTTLTPHFPKMIDHNDLEFLVLISFMQDVLYHATPLFKVFIVVSGHKNIERLFVPLQFVVDFRAILGTVSPY